MSWELSATRTRIWEMLEETFGRIEAVILTLSWATESPRGPVNTKTAGPHPRVGFSKSGVRHENLEFVQVTRSYRCCCTPDQPDRREHWCSTQRFTALETHVNQLEGFYARWGSDSGGLVWGSRFVYILKTQQITSVKIPGWTPVILGKSLLIFLNVKNMVLKES